MAKDNILDFPVNEWEVNEDEELENGDVTDPFADVVDVVEEEEESDEGEDAEYTGAPITVKDLTSSIEELNIIICQLFDWTDPQIINVGTEDAAWAAIPPDGSGKLRPILDYASNYALIPDLQDWAEEYFEHPVRWEIKRGFDELYEVSMYGLIEGEEKALANVQGIINQATAVAIAWVHAAGIIIEGAEPKA